MIFGIGNKNKYKKSFNLIYGQNRSLDTWDKLYMWLSGTCRIIIIFTLLFIVGSFVYRYSLERQSNDLKDEIQNLSFRLKSYENRQTEIARVQLMIDTYNSFWKTSSNYSTVIDTILNNIPVPLLSTYTVDVTLQGVDIKATSNRDIAAKMESDFKTSTSFINFVVANLAPSETKKEEVGMYDYSLRGDFSEKLTRPSLVLSELTDGQNSSSTN